MADMVSRRGFFRLLGGAAAALHLQPLLAVLPVEVAARPFNIADINCATRQLIVPEWVDEFYKVSPMFALAFKPKVYSAIITINGTS